MAPTLTKGQADYHLAQTTYDRNRYCKDCSMFRDGRCTLVKGLIDREGTCKHYDPKG
jgi:hypothetical protein